MLKLGGFKPAHFSHFYSKHGWDHQNNCKGCIYILGGGAHRSLTTVISPVP